MDVSNYVNTGEGNFKLELHFGTYDIITLRHLFLISLLKFSIKSTERNDLVGYI